MALFRRNRAQTPPVYITNLTGAGATYRVATYTDATFLTQLRQRWQQDAFDVYDQEGHLYYAANYIGDAMSRIQLTAARIDKTAPPDTRPEFVTTGPVAEAVRKISSPNGGQSGLLRQVGKNVFISGEVWMIGSEPMVPDGVSHQEWDAVSVDELQVGQHTSDFIRRRLPGSKGEPLPADALVVRIWKSHPRWSEWADAGTRSCLSLLEKIITINRAETAVARSRFAGSGILALPQELVPPAWQNQGNSPDAVESNPLMQALYEAMVSPISDPSHPNSVMPFVLVGPGDIIGKMKYEPMERTFDAEGASFSIDNAVKQVASTLELPQEVLLGMNTVTHWTAWAIKEDVFQAHIQPLIELFCEALTRKYLAQVLKPETLSTDRYEYIVWYDASQLIQRPDKGDKALALHDRFAISDEALRRETGFTDQDKAPDDEYAKRVGIKMADPGMALDGKPTPPPAPATAGGPGAAGPFGSRGKTPQGPRSGAPVTPSQRRKKTGTAQQDTRAPVSVNASGYSDANVLGKYDLRQLRVLRTMADNHVARAGRSLTAASSAADLITDEMIDEFAAFAEDAVNGAYMTTSPYLTRVGVPATFMNTAIGRDIRESISVYQTILNAMINDRAFSARDNRIVGEFFQGGTVQYGDVRPILVAMGGGSPDAKVALMGGPASGRTMTEWLSMNGVQSDQKIWLYGDTARRNFNGHQQMDGLVFEDWEDPALDIAPQDAWIRRAKYEPGDHWGCGCLVAPYVPNWGAPFEVELNS